VNFFSISKILLLEAKDFITHRYMNELEAVTQLKRGDVRGLEVLVRKYQLDAVRIANSITQDLSLAEEVVQEAFLRVYERIDQYDDSRPFRSWFLRIVVNDALKSVTRQNRFISIEGADEFDDSGEVTVFSESSLCFEQEEFSSSYENAQALQEMLTSLTPEHRAVLELKYYLDMSDEEIAMTVDIPLGTVKSRLHIAKLNLRSLLDRKDFSFSCR
jgi:RNA polymerase sigma-70 factor, ECF subfamily